MTTPPISHATSPRRPFATSSLWMCCAAGDGPGAERALAGGADAAARLEGPILDRVAWALRRKVAREDLAGLSPLALCARLARPGSFERLLRDPALAAIGARSGALRMAIASRSPAMARRAIELASQKQLGLDPGALAEAAGWGRIEVIEALLKLGADPNAAWRGAPPLIRAAERSLTRVVDLLAKSGASVESRRASDGASALMIAADKNDAALVSQLAGLGADVNAADASGRPALQRVALKRDAKAARRLLELGACPDPLCPVEKLTPLGRAMRSGNRAGAQALLEGGASHEVGLGRNWRIDPICARWEPMNLLGAWMRGFLREQNDSAPRDSLGCLRAAIAAGADLDAKDPGGDWPLRHALFSDDMGKAAARALLAAGASTEILDDKGLTLLETVILPHLGPRRRVGMEHVEPLLAHGAIVTPRLRRLIENDDWKAGYDYDFAWLELLRAAELRQREARELSAIVGSGKPSGPKRV